MIFETLSVFPDVFAPYLDASIMGRSGRASSSSAHTTCATGRTIVTAPWTTPRSAAGRACS